MAKEYGMERDGDTKEINGRKKGEIKKEISIRFISNGLSH
jgi:hypothetical protein